MNSELEPISRIEWGDRKDGEEIYLIQYDSEGEIEDHIVMTRGVALQLAREWIKDYELF